MEEKEWMCRKAAPRKIRLSITHEPEMEMGHANTHQKCVDPSLVQREATMVIKQKRKECATME
jgi:hypothetical protein